MLVGTPVPPVRAADNTMEDFEYDAVWWEDWTRTTTSPDPSSIWNANNHTMLLAVTIPGDSAGATSISRPLVPKADKIETSWYARHNPPTNDSYPPWWDGSWTYRQPVPIIGSASGAVTNYQLYFFLTPGPGLAALNTIHLNNHAQADFDDVRFVQGSTICDMWYERVTATAAIVWVEVPTIAAGPTVTSLYCYYGNPSAPSVASGANTFLAYDPWTGAPTSVGEGTFVINAPSWLDYATLGTASGWHGARTANVTLTEAQPSGLRVRTWWDFSSSAAANRMGRLWLKGTTSAYVGQFQFGMQDAAGAAIQNMVFYTDLVGSTSPLAVDIGPSNETWELRFWENAGTDWWAYRNFTSYAFGDLDYNYNVARWSIGIEAYSTYTISERTHDDWFFMAKFISPEPIATAGFEQYVTDPTPDAIFRVSFPYAVTTGWHFLNLTYSATNVTLSYYDGAGNPQSSSVALSLANAYAYLIGALALTQPVGPKVLTVTVKTALSVTIASFSISDPEAFPSGLTAIGIEARGVNYKYSYYYTSVELVVVKAPFPPVPGLRSWVTTDLESTDSPYSIHFNDLTEEASLKVMPFQGIKFLWNVTKVPVAGQNGAARVKIIWYSWAGTRVGGVIFETWAYATATDFNIYTVTGGGIETLIFARTGLPRQNISCAVWVEKSNHVFLYAQYTPHSSEFQDFFTYDITSFADLRSWGVQISHTTGAHTASPNYTSRLYEVEIFYALREGISQPRFGGMWWESNPILSFLFWFGYTIYSFFAGLFGSIAAIIAPGLTALANAIVNAWNAGANAIIDAVEAVVGAVGDWFVLNFLPAATTFVEAFIFVAIGLILTPVVGILAIISIFLTGDPFLLPVAVVNFFLILANVFTWIGTVFAGIVTFFGMMAAVASGQPIAVSGTALTLIELINRILYYIVTFGPLAILFHVMISVLACLPKGPGGDFTIEPLLNCGLLYYHIIETIASVVFRIVSFLTSIIISIMELIPF